MKELNKLFLSNLIQIFSRHYDMFMKKLHSSVGYFKTKLLRTKKTYWNLKILLKNHKFQTWIEQLLDSILTRIFIFNLFLGSLWTLNMFVTKLYFRLALFQNFSFLSPSLKLHRQIYNSKYVHWLSIKTQKLALNSAKVTLTFIFSLVLKLYHFMQLHKMFNTRSSNNNSACNFQFLLSYIVKL